MVILLKGIDETGLRNIKNREPSDHSSYSQTKVTELTLVTLIIYLLPRVFKSLAAHHFIGWCVCCHFPNPELSSAH